MDGSFPKVKTALEKALDDMADLGRRSPEAPRGPGMGVYDSPQHLHDFLAVLDVNRKATE